MGTALIPSLTGCAGATADLCDVHVPDAVDIITQPKVQILAPIFRCSSCM